MPPKETRGPQSTDWCFVSYKESIDTDPQDHVDYFICQLENCPSTGRRHWQGFVQFKSRQFRTGVQRLIGDTVASCHKRRGTAQEASVYCKKSETAVEPPQRFEWGTLIERGRTNKRNLDEVCSNAWNASSRDEALEVIVRDAPSLLWRNYNSVTSTLNFRFPTEKKRFVYEPKWAWRLPAAMRDWVATEFVKRERAKCLIVVGPTRLGKTNWARSLGTHMFWRGQVNFGNWDQEAKYIVIDDIPWKFIPQKKSILTQMGDITLTDKYVKKLDVKNDKPAIILSNDEPAFEEEESYWKSNTIIVHVTEKLFDENQLAINFS